MESSKLDPAPSPLDELIHLVKTLRGERGCPWDKKQTPRDICIYLIEEAFELVDAIETGRPEQIREELGDVLFQIVFIARMFQERGEFNLSDVSRTITKKMIRRHPHVFGEEKISNDHEVVDNWHKIKLNEKKATLRRSSLDSVPVQLPALIRAYRLADRAANSGFDWTEVDEEFDRVKLEMRGLKAFMDKQGTPQFSEIFGDLLFSIVNIARLAKIHPETALAGSNKRFELRFKMMEDLLAEKEQVFESMPLKEKGLIWAIVKDIVR